MVSNRGRTASLDEEAVAEVAEECSAAAAEVSMAMASLLRKGTELPEYPQ